MRIRTIKPEFWTDSTMVSLPRDTRLVFIGLWNAADDHGWLPDDPAQLKMLLFPGEPEFDFDHHLETLICFDRIERGIFEDGTTILHIANWNAHQRVDRPSGSKLAREGSRKLAIPLTTRRKVAEKYKCPPGGSIEAKCFYCERGGMIHWSRTSRGAPSGWVTFPGFELDHFVSELEGGEPVVENLVLACRNCNRSKGTKHGAEFFSRLSRHFANTREDSRSLVLGSGIRDQGSGKGSERAGATPTAGVPSAPPSSSNLGTGNNAAASPKPRSENGRLSAADRITLEAEFRRNAARIEILKDVEICTVIAAGVVTREGETEILERRSLRKRQKEIEAAIKITLPEIPSPGATDAKTPLSAPSNT